MLIFRGELGMKSWEWNLWVLSPAAAYCGGMFSFTQSSGLLPSKFPFSNSHFPISNPRFSLTFFSQKSTNLAWTKRINEVWRCFHDFCSALLNCLTVVEPTWLGFANRCHWGLLRNGTSTWLEIEVRFGLRLAGDPIGDLIGVIEFP